jgi:HD superfamily phosphodiesterase
MTYLLDPLWFTRPNSIHGLSHTRRVLIHAAEIARSVVLEHGEFDSLVAAIAWHDIGRTHDGWDREHGAKSVRRIAELGLADGSQDPITATIRFAVELHSTYDELAVERAAKLPESESLLRVLWVLKDADGLDRVRIADLDPLQLRHPVSRTMVDRAWELLRQFP